MNHRERFESLRDQLDGRLTAAGVSSWEIYYGSSSRLGIAAEDGEVEDYSFSAPYGVSLRIIVDGGIGFSFATRPDDGALDRMVADSLAGARNTTPDERYRFADPAEKVLNVGSLTDGTMENVPLPEKIERALTIERAALAVDPKVKKVRGARYGEVRAAMFLTNSLGVDVGYEKTVVSAQTMAMAGDGGDQEMGWEAEFALTADEVNPERVGRRAGELAVSRLGAKKAPTCSCTALFTPQAAVDLLVGARYWEVDSELSFSGGLGALAGRRITNKEDWIDPFVGLKGRLPLGESRFFIAGGAALGGFDVGSEVFYELNANVGYQWNRSIGTTIGYRLFDVDYDKDDFLYDVRQQGWQLGLSWSF